MTKWILSWAIIIMGLEATVRAEGGSEQLVVLPLFGYSDEQGMGFGANAAWLSLMGTGWSFTSELYLTQQYNSNDLKLGLINKSLFGFLYVDSRATNYKSSRMLFYGPGNDSSDADPSQLKMSDATYSLRVGTLVYGPVTAGLGYFRRNTGIDTGSDPALVQYLDRYNTYPNLSGVNYRATEIFALYDTRAPDFAPQAGEHFEVSLQKLWPTGDENMALEKFEVLGDYYYPLSDKAFLIVGHGEYRYVWGNDNPFFTQSRLGGVNTLRSFRNNRFVDSGSILFNVEPRWTFWTPGGAIFSRFELSCALDYGRVFSGTTLPPITGFHPSYVLGLTGLIGANIPLRLDYATGPEGRLIYLHLFYPF